MTTRGKLHAGIAAGAILIGLTLLSAPAQVRVASSSEPSDGPALRGQVSSAAEGAMEGVLVSAQRATSNMTITVVSNASGAYAFPKDRLEPGEYTLRVRAPGYVLPGPEKTVEVTGGRTTVTVNLTLEPASLLDKALQLTSAEWLYSYPLPEQTKYATLRD